MSQNFQKNIMKEIVEKTVRNFLDIFILSALAKTDFIGGYGILTKINQEYGLLLSPGTVYNALYKLEREGLIESQEMSKGRIYKITKKGKRCIELINRNRLIILRLAKRIILGSP
ncbi:hypothetical protein DRO54_01595 [Candidatus Bathyarchaeota archaeon]|nr:MAG: hypothetical protein DRO54_01595 [Candidatus Bathyarchaeota archaeon]